MSSFEVRVYKLEIQPHPNADNIELAKVGDYLSIVRKGDFRTGSLGIYIPEQAVVPQDVLQLLGLVGKLSGPKKDRVKAVKLRGMLSQGLIYPVDSGEDTSGPFISLPTEDGIGTMLPVVEGQDVQKELGITKWEPPPETIPQQMRGRAVGVALDITVNYDVENIKKYNNVFSDGEEVIMKEKIHGTFVQIGYIPLRLFRPSLHLGAYTVTSKGLGGRGVILDYGDHSNVYSRVAERSDLQIGAKLPVIKAEYKEIIGDRPIYLCGEIFGGGVQRGFDYGMASGEAGFRFFDIAYGERGDTQYIDAWLLDKIAKDYELPIVPTIYRGPFSVEALMKATSGKETVSGHHRHIREGVVVKPIKERVDSKAGRVILKSVSEAYLTRKGDVTEFQ
jgi:RNA ligase (TIGR02306 family)